MEPQTIIQKLSAEARQSPGKALFLAVGLTFAIYKWVPLVTQMGKAAETSAVVSSPINASAPSPSLSDSSTSGVRESNHWFQQYQTYRTLPLLQPALVDAELESAPEAVELEPESSDSVFRLSDELQKLHCRSVLVGGRGKPMASLNGEILNQGDQVWMDFSQSHPAPRKKPVLESTSSRWLRVTIDRIHQDWIEVHIGDQAGNVPVKPKL